MRREIVFSARDNGVSSFMDKMRRSSVEVGRGILEDSVAQSKSAKEAVRNYEQQISLIEKKNRLEKEAARVQAERTRDRDLTTATSAKEQEAAKSKFSDTVKQINDGSREDKIQTDLLRELIRTVRHTADQEIRQDATNSDRESDDLERLLQGEDSTAFRSVADRLREERTPEEREEQSRIASGGAVVAGGAAKVANSGSGTGAIQSTLDSIGKGPILGTIAGLVAVAVAGLNIRAQREQSAEMVAALTGASARGIEESGLGGTDFFGGYGPATLGVAREQFLQNNLPASMRAAGTANNSYARAMAGLELEKAWGLSEGTAGSMTRLGRVTGGPDSHKMANSIYSSMYGTGALGANNTDMSRMQDMISGLVNFGESQLMRAGVTNDPTTLRFRRGLERIGGRFTRDDYAMQTVQSVNQGLASEGSAEARAIKFDVLRRQNPNKSFFELQTEMEKGVSSKGYLEGMLNFVKSTGGDLNSQSLLFDSLTGGQVRKRDITDMLKGELPIEDYTQREADIKGRAVGATSRANEQLINFTEQFKDVLSGVGGGVESALGMLKSIDSKLGTIANALD